MLRAKRDKFGGAAGSAVPALGEIGGRAFVLQAVASAALTRLLRRCDVDGQTDLLEALRRAIERKVRQAKMPEAQIPAVSEYAQELFEEAQERANKSPAAEQ